MNALTIAVLVGGDLARSTRALEVARVLASRGARVLLAGYVDSPLPPRGGVEVRVVPAFERLRGRGLLFYPMAALRQLALAVAWRRTLRRMHVDVVIVQNPPAFPLLLLTRPTIVDWHNTTSAMLRLRGDSWLVRLVERFEFALARRAAGHLAVSEALRRHLADHRIEATTLYDAPAQRVVKQHTRTDVVQIIVPSSWTDDDDFALLEEVARRWDGPPLRFVLTGRGPRRAGARFENGRRVTFELHWFESDEYPDALATADVGLSLHHPREGLDLPMKLVEMLACGLPVCALDYGPVLRERYTEGEGVRFFGDAEGLVALLGELLEGWPSAKALDALRASVHDALPRTWEDEWRESAEPLLQRVIQRS